MARDLIEARAEQARRDQVQWRNRVSEIAAQIAKLTGEMECCREEHAAASRRELDALKELKLLK